MKKLNVKGAAMKVVATGGGAVAAASLNKIDFVKNQQPVVRGAIKVAAGAFLPQLLGRGGKKSEMISDACSGFIAVGALEMANATIFKASPLGIAGVPTLGSLPFYTNADSHVPVVPMMTAGQQGYTLGNVPEAVAAGY